MRPALGSRFPPVRASRTALRSQFGVAKTIAGITRDTTLVPDDVIWIGTDDPTLDMVAGDEVEIAITGIGALRIPVRAAAREPRGLVVA